MDVAQPTAFTVWEAAAYWLFVVVREMFIGVGPLRDVLSGSLGIVDGYMRLVRVRDMLAERTLLHVVARDGSGDGTLLHWSHLLDALILILSAPLRAVMSADEALRLGAALVGPISAGLLGAALAWVLAPLVSREWRWLAPAAAMSCAYIVGFGRPGVVHHHVLAAFTITMTVGYAIRAAAAGARAGRLMGFWGGLGLWLTPETMPFTLAAFSGVGVAWLFGPSRLAYGRALLAGGVAFLLLVAAAFAIDPPYGGYGTIEIDRISIVYVVLAAVVLVIGWSTWQLDRMRLGTGRRAALGIAVAVAGLGMWLVLFPAVAKGPDGLMDAEQAKAFFGTIEEMQPVTSFDFGSIALFDGALAVAMLLVIAARTRSPVWTYGAVAGSLTLVLGFMHVRFLTYPGVLAAATVPLAVTCCQAWTAHRPVPVQVAARLSIIVTFWLVPLGAVLLMTDAWATASRAAAAAPGCSLRTLGPLLAPYAGEVVLADVNDTPELLYRTEIRTVGSLYHANAAAYMRLRAAWRSAPSEQEPEEVRATRASLVLFCPNKGRESLLAGLPPNTLWDRLTRGEVPPWLKQIGEDPQSGYVLYRVTVR